MMFREVFNMTGKGALQLTPPSEEVTAKMSAEASSSQLSPL